MRITEGDVWCTENGDKTWLHSSTGDMVYPLALTDDQIAIEDIAIALSRRARYNGWTTRFLSVAEHCVRGSWMLPEDERALYFLLHDAAEAYPPGDIPRPLKDTPLFAPLLDLQKRNQSLIYRHYGLDPDAVPDCVHEVDSRMLATEKRDLLRRGRAKWTVVAQPYPGRIEPWLPDEARAQFMLRFRQLTGTLSPDTRPDQRRPRPQR